MTSSYNFYMYNQSIKLYIYQLGADKVVVVAKRSLLNIIMNRPPLALRLGSIRYSIDVITPHLKYMNGCCVGVLR